MSRPPYCVLIPAILTCLPLVPGCARSTNSRLVHCHDNGTIRSVHEERHSSMWDRREVRYGYTSDYDEDQRLAAETWFDDRGPIRRLTFHENGRLRSEEQLNNGQVEYAAYYDENGDLQRTVGSRGAMPGAIVRGTRTDPD